MTVECSKCQTNNSEESKFCMECATPLPKIQDAAHTKTIETPIETLTTGSMGKLLAFAEVLSRRKASLPDALDILQSWFRDLIIWKMAPEKIVNQDLSDRIQEESKKESVESSLRHIEAIQGAKKEIQGNANVRLSLEKMAMKLAVREWTDS